MKPRVIAGFDLATISGVAIFDGDSLIHSESFRSVGENDAEIFTSFRRRVIPLLKDHGVEYVGLEEPLRSDIQKTEKDGSKTPISSMKTYLRLYGFRAHAIQICHAMNIEFREVNQSSWRKAFAGNGRASKEDTVARCKLLGFPYESKDACEAIGVAFWLRGHLSEQDLFRRAGDAA